VFSSLTRQISQIGIRSELKIGRYESALKLKFERSGPGTRYMDAQNPKNLAVIVTLFSIKICVMDDLSLFLVVAIYCFLSFFTHFNIKPTGRNGYESFFLSVD
jgi:hypothetical protein